MSEEELYIDDGELVYYINENEFFTCNDIPMPMLEGIEHLQQKVEQLEERCEYLERSNNRREDEIIELRDENVDLVSKNNQLENIIDVKKYDYDYLETLFSKSSKEEVLKAYTYKCEQLEKVMEARNEFEMKSMQLENIRKEATDFVNNNTYEYFHDGNLKDKALSINKTIFIDNLLNILNKGSDKE